MGVVSFIMPLLTLQPQTWVDACVVTDSTYCGAVAPVASEPGSRSIVGAVQMPALVVPRAVTGFPL